MKHTIAIIISVILVLFGVYFIIEQADQPKTGNYRVSLFATDGHEIKHLDGRFTIKYKYGVLTLVDDQTADHKPVQYLLSGTYSVQQY